MYKREKGKGKKESPLYCSRDSSGSGIEIKHIHI